MVNICGVRHSLLPSILGGSCDTVTPVALQRQREVPGHCETEALVFKQINTIGWPRERYLHRVIWFIERQPSVCTECTWE